MQLSQVPVESIQKNSTSVGKPELLYKRYCIYKYEKHFPKMYRDVGMAVPKTTETRCRDGSVQERQGIQTLHK